MAWGKKTGGKDFNKNNPPPKSPGAPKLSPEACVLRKLTADEFIKKVTKYLSFSVDKLKEVMLNSKSDSLDVYICKCILVGMIKGDYDKLDKMLDRVIGKVTTKLEHSGPDGAAIVLRFDKTDEIL